MSFGGHSVYFPQHCPHIKSGWSQSDTDWTLELEDSSRTCMGSFDLVVFKVIWSRTQLNHRPKFLTRGRQDNIYMDPGASLIYVGGHMDAVVSKLAHNSKTTGNRMTQSEIWDLIGDANATHTGNFWACSVRCHFWVNCGTCNTSLSFKHNEKVGARYIDTNNCSHWPNYMIAVQMIPAECKWPWSPCFISNMISISFFLTLFSLQFS